MPRSCFGETHEHLGSMQTLQMYGDIYCIANKAATFCFLFSDYLCGVNSVKTENPGGGFSCFNKQSIPLQVSSISGNFRGNVNTQIRLLTLVAHNTYYFQSFHAASTQSREKTQVEIPAHKEEWRSHGRIELKCACLHARDRCIWLKLYVCPKPTIMTPTYSIKNVTM